MAGSDEMTSLSELGLSKGAVDLALKALDEGIDCASSGEVMMPFVMTLSGDPKPTLHRLVTPDMPGAEHMVGSLLARTEDPIRSYAFATDTYITIDGKKDDAIIVEVGERGGPNAFLIAQRYQRAVDGKEFGPIGARIMFGREPSRFDAKAQRNATSKQDYNAEDWETLVRAPVLAFLVVAGADGKVDAKEVKAFLKQVMSGFQFTSALMSAILVEVLVDFESLIRRTAQSDANPTQQIQRVAEVVDARLDPALANEFKLSLIAIAKQVAEASGGFFGFGSKISKSEMQALAGLMLLLQVQLPGQ